MKNKKDDDLKIKISTIIKMVGMLNDKNIERICNSLDISPRDLYYLFKVCFSNDKENIKNKTNVTNVNNMEKYLIYNMSNITYDVASTMVKCDREGEIYNLYNHYDKYGISPYAVSKVAKALGQRNISDKINWYIENHGDIFTTISSEKIEGMQKRTSLYELNFYLEGEKVSYNRRSLTRALNTLKEESIPIYKGTLYETLKMEKEKNIMKKNNKIMKKVL